MADQFTKTIIIGAPISAVYDLWANFENFPYFMKHIKAVTKTGDRTSHWVMEGPVGMTFQWDADTTLLEQDARIAWNSRDSGDIKTSGQAIFTELPTGQTQVTVTLQYVAPGGTLGQAAAKLLENPEGRLEEDLRNFKLYAEERAGGYERSHGAA
ncbi:MAG: hypothetical protein RLZZ387_460 [Chloroflexota bacterium]|jgi:uncharacterized membrane protein